MKTMKFSVLGMIILGICFVAVACSKEASAPAAPESATPAAAEAGAPAVKNGFDGMPAPGTKAFCPIMKQEFEVTAESEHSVHDGKTYVFCCPGCKPTFEEDPAKHAQM